MNVRGTCLCGGVSFEVSAASLWCAHCHCSMCQRAHGAAFVTWVGYDASQAKILDHKDLLRWYTSSIGAERGFCHRCGSTVFFRSIRWPGELHVTRASIAGKIDRDPQQHVFYGRHVDWVRLGDELPRS